MPSDVEEIDDSGKDSDELLVDAEEDSVHLNNFNLVGRRLKALYNNDQFTGVILYFNTSLNECKVQFYDGSTNHIQPGNIDNTDRTREDR